MVPDAPIKEASRVAGEAIKLLVVEDDPDDALLLREMLAEVTVASFEIVHTERLAEALAWRPPPVLS